MEWRFGIRSRRDRVRRPPARSSSRLAGPEACEPRMLLAGDPAATGGLAAITTPEAATGPASAAEILPAALPNDPSFAVEWGMVNTGQYGGLPGNDIAAAGAWEFTTGSRNVVVAVIDSGIDLTHPDLAANLWVNPGEIAGDGIDNDANGFIDDVHGWDFVEGDGVPQDGFGHGTHVAGIIGAVGNDGVGVTGVNWRVSIMALRVQDDRGAGMSSAVVAALRYATMMRRDHGVMIVASNNSWSAPAGFSSVMEQAIREHGEAGITFVAAAGNNGTDTDVTVMYPGGYDLANVITVASLTPSGTLALSSNYGATSVDIAAPGTAILSTHRDGTYATLSGTSMAAPHVTGVAALLAAARPGITVPDLRAAILGTAAPLAGLVGKVASGRLDARAALASLGVSTSPPPPATPPAPQPPPVASGVPLPFADAFAIADGPIASPSWLVREGRLAVVAGGLVPRSAVALVTLRGAVEADVTLTALLDVRRGGAAGLVVRHDPASGARLVAQLVRVPGGFRARILRHHAGQWQVLASRAAPAGRGLLRFDAVGDSLRLSFNGRPLVAASSGGLVTGGALGLQLGGIAPRAENFSARVAA